MSVGALCSYQSVVLAGASLGTSVFSHHQILETDSWELTGEEEKGFRNQAGAVSGPVSVVLFLSLPAPLLCTALPLSVC